MVMAPKRGSIFYLPAFVLSFLCLFFLVERTGAQATTDPSEVEALNAMMERWGLRWTTWLAWVGNEPCVRAATMNSTVLLEDSNFGVAIACDCSYNNNTTCHITQLF